MLKAQSAMEYLITYSWALLIIAVALASLYALGFFDTNTFAARAQPGGCQVFRPYGPGTQQLVNFQGVCGTAIPKTVALFNGNSKITVANSVYLALTNQLTVTAWVYASSPASATQSVVSKPGVFSLNTITSWFTVTFSPGASSTTTANYPGPGGWHFVAATYNKNANAMTTCIYVDGSLIGSCGSQSPNLNNNGNITIGSGFSGKMSNLQLYNASLNSNQIYTMYVRGIGAPPLVLQYLTGWWPLNSDMNDYSGNLDNGFSNTISFSAAWTGGYTH
jgi:hypothetical protein